MSGRGLCIWATPVSLLEEGDVITVMGSGPFAVVEVRRSGISSGDIATDAYLVLENEINNPKAKRYLVQEGPCSYTDGIEYVENGRKKYRQIWVPSCDETVR